MCGTRGGTCEAARPFRGAPVLQRDLFSPLHAPRHLCLGYDGGMWLLRKCEKEA